MKKKELALSIKDKVGRVRAFADGHLTLGLTVTALIGLGLTAAFMWDEVPKAQEEIKRKKEVDPNASNLELVAAAVPHMKKTIVAVTVTGGCIIAHEYISNARLMAATAFGAAAFSDKKALERKIEELMGKKKADEVKAEMHNATTINPDNEDDPILEGDTADHTEKTSVKQKQEMLLNKLHRFELDWDGRSIYTTIVEIEQINKFIKETYGKSAKTNWHGKPFPLSTVGNLLSTNFGDMGNVLGYPDGDGFEITYSPAYDKHTGEMFFIASFPEPVSDWDLPFA
jgi:hypothetical protein